MSINFREEVLKRKEQIIADLQNLIKIESVLTTFDPKRTDAPFGEGNKEALDFFLNLGNKDGFKTVNVNNYAGHIEYGKGKEYVGIIGHLDVVPAGNGWKYPPFGGEIHGGKMFGRGTVDDKGPTMAAYYAMKILKELNVPLSKRVKLILGVDEESGWRCVDHYFKKYPEVPVSGFIPDADFPLIYAEKGIVRINVTGNYSTSNLISFSGGLRDNMVPDKAEAVVRHTMDIKSLYLNYLKKNKYQGTITKEGNFYYLSIIGKSAHGAKPDLGVNAIDILNKFLISINIKNTLTNTIDNYLSNETDGNKLNIKYSDEEMGPLTVNLGVLETDGNRFKLVLNVRYPNGVNFDKLIKSISRSLNGLDVNYERHQKLLYKDPNSHLVQTLLNVYKKHTNDLNAKPLTIGGGTFARATENVLAYGPTLPGRVALIHQKDEYIKIDDLILATIIYTEALYELAK